MELASDIFVLLGALLIIGGLWAIWWPLAPLAGGAALIALGYIFHVRARMRAAKAKL